LETELVVDASPVGIAGILQKQPDGNFKPIAYGSRALTDVEKRYSQMEREALAIVWGCEYYHIYLYATEFTLVTDHKPLEMILNKPYSKPPARIERWNLRLSQYKFKTKYRPGKDIPADYMSRNPDIGYATDMVAENYVRFLVNHSPPLALTLEQVQEETTADITLGAVRKAIQSGKWYEALKVPEVDINDLKVLEKCAHELSVIEDPQSSEKFVILKDNLLVIPKSLQKSVVCLAHEGHQGITKTKQLLRQKVWFRGMNSLVEGICQSCLACQAATYKKIHEPLQMSELPADVWHSLCADFCGPFPNGFYLLVVMDEYSRFPVVEMVRSTSAQSTIEKLDATFSMFGVPYI